MLDIHIHTLLESIITHGGSDLHLAVGSPPCVRVNGALTLLADFPPLSQVEMEHLIYPILDHGQLELLQKNRNLDLSYSIPGVSRYRGCILWQRGTLGAVFRAIPARPFTLEELAMPPIIASLAMKDRGLILVTGPTGSGKSTTLAAMIEHINRNQRRHIVTIEDPIEYLHRNNLCIIRQREVGTDVNSFEEALRAILRQDPDVILVGEMRDLETISLAITAAETGHLVLATLHTSSAALAIDRVIDVFPAGQQQQIRLQLAMTVEGVICQALLPRADGKGRVSALEIMVGTTAVRNIIRDGKNHLLTGVLEQNAKLGMQSLNMALKDLVQRRIVTTEAALERTVTPDELLSHLMSLPHGRVRLH